MTITTRVQAGLVGALIALSTAGAAKAKPMISDYTIGQALKEVKCGRRDMRQTSMWFGQMGVTDAYLNGPAMSSVDFHKGFMYGSADC